MNGEGNGNPLQCFCLENPRDGGAWWAAIYGVAQSRTRLKWLSNSRITMRIKWVKVLLLNISSIYLLRNTNISIWDAHSITSPLVCCCCCCLVTSVMSDSVRPHRRQSIRLPRPWDSPDKNTGVGCHFLLRSLVYMLSSVTIRSSTLLGVGGT